MTAREATDSTIASDSGPSLANALIQAGGPVQLLRNIPYDSQPFLMTPEFTNWRSEQQAWSRSCVLFDQTDSMTDLFLSGPDALKLLSRLGVNSFAAFPAGSAKQFVAVAPDGHMIGDSVLFHLDEGLYDLTGHTIVLDWVQFHAESGEYDVTVERDGNTAVRASTPPRFYRFELQGPTSTAIMEQLTGTELPPTKFFHMTQLEVAGHVAWALRHGMAGQPGFELFGPWADGAALLEAILEVGAEHGLIRAGRKAYSTANLGSGWVPAPLPAIYGDHPVLQSYRDWLPANAVASIGGSMDSTKIEDYYLTPYDLGYGGIVKFDHDFIGREALERLAADPPRTKVTLVWNGDDVAAAHRSLYAPGPGAKYIDMPKARYSLHQEDKVLRDGEQVGISLDCGYLANERVMVSLATVDVEHSQPGTELTVLWGESPNSAKPQVEEHVQVPIRATVAPVPYATFARGDYRTR